MSLDYLTTSSNSLAIEAEDMNLGGEYRVETNQFASGGKIISLRGGNNNDTGSASFKFGEATGKYNIKVTYFDEDDGTGQIKIKQNSQTLKSFRLDKQLGSHLADEKTKTTLEIKNVDVESGDNFQIEGIEQGSKSTAEHARIDRVDFIPSKSITVGFERHNEGTKYNRSAQDKDWDVSWSKESWMNNYAFIDDEAHSGDKSLRITYRPDATTGGAAGWKLSSEKEYYLSYWVKFENDFDFNGSKYSGGKLPGLGGAGGLCSGGQTCNGNNGFTARYMWKEDGRASLYLYHMNKQSKWGENYRFKDISGNDVYFQRGQWHNLIQRVQINDGNQSNGEVDVWMDGKQVLSLDDLKFVTNNKGIDNLFFSTFHGGNSSGWWPERQQYSYFDDFVVSTNAADVGL